MRLGLVMFTAVGVVVGTALWLERNDVELARRKLVAEAEKLRPFLSSTRFDTTPDAETIACMDRLLALDAQLDLVGDRVTWRPESPAELDVLEHEVEPILDALAALAIERSRRGPLPCETMLWRSHQRTKLFCIAALIETDPARARMRLEQAFDLLLLDDDGGALAFSVQNFDAGTICRTVRERAERHGRDPELERSLKERFDAALGCEQLHERIARDIVRGPHRADETVECVPLYERWMREAGSIRAVLAGELDPAILLGRAHKEGLCFLGNFYCDPESASILESQRRM